jgi:hypothetical protein
MYPADGSLTDLISLNRVLSEKLIVAQLVKTLPTSYAVEM